jgi:hypothetical protein
VRKREEEREKKIDASWIMNQRIYIKKNALNSMGLEGYGGRKKRKKRKERKKPVSGHCQIISKFT